MITIPDLIDNIKKKLIRVLDFYYSIIESLGVKFTNYAWHKRWCNREHGTGYWQSREKTVKYLSGKGK